MSPYSHRIDLPSVMSSLAWAEYSRFGTWKEQTLICTVVESEKSIVKVRADAVSSEGLLPS